MKSILTLILTMLTIATLVGMVTTRVQQAYAPRDCAGCAAFKKLTHEFEKNVIDAASKGDPNLIPNMLEQYNQDVRAYDFSTP